MLLDFSVGTSDNPIKKGESNDRRAYQIFFLPPHWYRSINEAALLATRRGSSVNPPIELVNSSREFTRPLSLSLSFFLSFLLSFFLFSLDVVSSTMSTAAAAASSATDA